MTNAQTLTAFFTIAVSFIAVLFGVLLNNARLTDIRVYTAGQMTSMEAGLRAQINAVDAALRAEIRASEAQTREQLGAQIGELKILFTELKGLIERNHSETLMRFADVDRRLSALETERRPA